MSIPSVTPEFLDTDGCACGLVKSPAQTGASLLWRCVANEHAKLDQGTGGKWFNTTNQELATGPNHQILNSPANGPNTDQAYIWGDHQFAISNPQSSSLSQADQGCTGTNDTARTTTFLRGSGGSSSSSLVATVSSSMAGTTVAASSATTSSTSSPTTSTSTTSSPGVKSQAHQNTISIKQAAILLLLPTLILRATYG